MKFSFQTAFFVILGLIAPLIVPARDYYIMYDESCMDRLEYGYGFTPQNQNYVKYHVKINPTEVLVLEVGTEDDAPTQTYLSSTTISCGNDILSRSLLNKVRGSEDQVFVVQPKGNRYKISKVNMASYWKRDNRGLVYDSWQFSFNYLGTLEPGQVLSNDPSKGIKVTYQGMTPYQCTDAFLFRMTFLNGSSSYRDIFLIPGLGIAEERPNTGSPDDIYKLRNVDGMPFDTYLQQNICNSGVAAASSYMPTTSGSQAGRATLTPRGVATSSQSGPKYHEVEKGETLYSISRKYDISVSQLREWNDLGNSSLLKIGDRLLVSSSGDLSQSPIANELPLPDQGSSFAFNDSGSGQSNMRAPTETLQAKGGRDARFAWETTDGTHTVKSGETVALLAMRYGYTEARFRDMNDLGPNEMIKVGQVLKTTDCPPSNQLLDRGYSAGGSVSSNLPATSSNNWSRPAPYSNESYGNTAGNQFTEKSGAATTTERPSTSASPYTLPTTSSSFEPYASNSPNFTIPPDEPEEVPRSYDTQTYYARGGSGVMRNYEERMSSQPASRESSRQSSYNFGTPIPKSGGVVTGENPYSPYDQPERYQGIPQSYDNSNQSGTSSQRVYVVREGDTIESIARRFNTTPEQIRQLNDLEEREILIPYTRLYIN